MLTGKPPFAAATKPEALELARKGTLSAQLPDPDHPISKLCLKCISNNPANRFASAREVVDATRETIRVPGTRVPGRLLPAVAAGALLLGAIVYFAVSWSATDRRPDDANRPVTAGQLEQAEQPAAVGKTWWVDGSLRLVERDSTGVGTRDDAFVTIAAALKAAGPNDTIRIRGHADGQRLRYREALATDPDRHVGITITNWEDTEPDQVDHFPVIVGLYPLGPDLSEEREVAASANPLCPPLLWITADNVVIRGIVFHGSCGDGLAIQKLDRRNDPVMGVRVEQCEFFQTYGPGIRISGAVETTVESIKLNRCGATLESVAVEVEKSSGTRVIACRVAKLGPREHLGGGIRIANSNDSGVSACEFRELDLNDAIVVTSSNQSRLLTNFIYSCRTGVKLFNGNHGFHVLGNVIASCEEAGILIDSKGQLISNLDIDYNTIHACGKYGLQFSNGKAKDVCVTSNLILDNTEGDLFLAADLADASITHNLVSESESRGVGLRHSGEKNIFLDSLPDAGPQLWIQRRLESGDRPLAGAIRSYRLLRDSIARDTGRTWPELPNSLDILGTRRGETPDLGAIELVSPEE